MKLSESAAKIGLFAAVVGGVPCYDTMCAGGMAYTGLEKYIEYRSEKDSELLAANPCDAEQNAAIDEAIQSARNAKDAATEDFFLLAILFKRATRNMKCLQEQLSKIFLKN